MDEKDFILQSRYQIRPAVNSVTDILLQTEIRIEPRLIKILCILAKHPGQLVTRDKLVADVWNDYGGGEAGLTHAISSLRKLLNDSSKQLIETIPTKGYILHAAISDASNLNKAKESDQKRKFPRRFISYASAISIAAVMIYFLFQFQTTDKKQAQTVPLANKSVSVPFDEVNKKTEETWFNTITTVGDDGTEYKLKVIGDRRPEFYINKKLVSPDEMEKHFDLINNLKVQLRRRSE